MKIAVIGVKGISSNQGEIERYCQEFYPRIAARGHQVDLFVTDKSNQEPWFSVVYHHNVRVIALSALPKHRSGLMLSSAISTIWASLGSYDVIHIHSMKAAWFSWFPQLFSGSKIIVTSHQLEIEGEQTRWRKAFGWLSSWLEGVAVRNAHEVVVVSKALGEYFQHKYDIRPHYIPNAPGTQNSANLEFSYGESLGLEPGRYILYTGKLTPENQLDILLKAFQKLEHDGWKLILAGEISNSLKYAIELLSLAKDNQNIIFTNEIRGKNLEEIVKHAGLLVVPNDGTNLGLPLTALEAMKEKIPVLASNNRIYRELIGKNRGLLFETGNSDSLLEKMQYTVSEPSAIAAMTRNAQTFITINHNWDRVTYGNLSLYLKTTAKVDSPTVQTNF